ncbi:MAG: hypothetical protein AB7G48_13255 [Nitrospiraceae bacterium]
MKFWAITCKVLGYVWLVLAGLLILVGIVGVWMKEGFSGVQDLLSPFNVANYVVTIITLAPGIGLLMLSDKLQAKARSKVTEA